MWGIYILQTGQAPFIGGGGQNGEGGKTCSVHLLGLPMLNESFTVEYVNFEVINDDYVRHILYKYVFYYYKGFISCKPEK